MSAWRVLSAVAVVFLATGCAAVSSTVVRVRDVDQLSLAIPTQKGPKAILKPNSPPWPPAYVIGERQVYAVSWPDYRLRFCCELEGSPVISEDGRIELAGKPSLTLGALWPRPGRPFEMDFKLSEVDRRYRTGTFVDHADAALLTPGENVVEILEHRMPNLAAGNGALIPGLLLAALGTVLVAGGTSTPSSSLSGMNVNSTETGFGIASLILGVPLMVAGVAVLGQPDQTVPIWHAP